MEDAIVNRVMKTTMGLKTVTMIVTWMMDKSFQMKILNQMGRYKDRYRDNRKMKMKMKMSLLYEKCLMIFACSFLNLLILIKKKITQKLKSKIKLILFIFFSKIINTFLTRIKLI